MAVLLLSVLPLCGCPGFGDQVAANIPASPTWEDDVRFILEDGRCTSCHAATPNQGAPATFRLDSYAGDDAMEGAFEKRDRILQRAVEEGSMPPTGGGLDATQAGTVARWVEIGAPETVDDLGTR